MRSKLIFTNPEPNNMNEIGNRRFLPLDIMTPKERFLAGHKWFSPGQKEFMMQYHQFETVKVSVLIKSYSLDDIGRIHCSADPQEKFALLTHVLLTKPAREKVFYKNLQFAEPLTF